MNLLFLNTREQSNFILANEPYRRAKIPPIITALKTLPSLFWVIYGALLQIAFTLSSKVSYDRRSQLMNQIKCLPLDYLMLMVYPRLYAVHMLTENVRRL